MRVNRYLIPASAVVLIAASVAIAQLSGQWVASGGQALSRRIAAGEQINAADIKGWMTFSDVSKTYGIPADELMKGLGLKDTPISTPLRELESTGFDVETVREWVADFTGQPLTTTGGERESKGGEDEGEKGEEPMVPEVADEPAQAEETTAATAAKGAATSVSEEVAPVAKAPVVAKAPTNNKAVATTKPAVAATSVTPTAQAATKPTAPQPTAAPTTATTSTTAAVTHEGTGTGSPESGASAGTAEIRGTSTLAEVASSYKIPLADLMEEAGLPAGAATDVPMRDLKESVPGFEVDVVRAAVAKLSK